MNHESSCHKVPTPTWWCNKGERETSSKLDRVNGSSSPKEVHLQPHQSQSQQNVYLFYYIHPPLWFQFSYHRLQRVDGTELLSLYHLYIEPELTRGGLASGVAKSTKYQSTKTKSLVIKFVMLAIFCFILSWCCNVMQMYQRMRIEMESRPGDFSYGRLLISWWWPKLMRRKVIAGVETKTKML